MPLTGICNFTPLNGSEKGSSSREKLGVDEGEPSARWGSKVADESDDDRRPRSVDLTKTKTENK